MLLLLPSESDVKTSINNIQYKERKMKEDIVGKNKFMTSLNILEEELRDSKSMAT